jgi:5'-deoxynucleotidase YfbR-like HD superfamily hydrolase
MAQKTPDPQKIHEDIDELLEGFLDYSTNRLSSIIRYNTKSTIRKQTVMEHSGAVALIAMTFSDYFNRTGIKNDTERVMRIAILHDADEVVSGDIPHDAKYNQGKLSDELRAALDKLTDYTLDRMFHMMNNDHMYEKYRGLIKEEKERKTVESRIAKLADIAEAIIYCRNEEKIGNKVLAEIHSREINKFHTYLNSIIEEKGRK